MQLSEQNLRFFETFGYLAFPRLFLDEIGAISNAFDHVWAANGRELDGTPDDLDRQTIVVPFIDQHEYLSALIDDPRILGIATALCGDDFNYTTSDGNVYCGDTPWHSDGPPGKAYTSIKIAFYLDRLDVRSGSLRVMPGSHHQNDRYARSLGPIDYYRAPSDARTGLTEATWNVEGQDVPATALESQPGDVLVFHHELKHASFGGDSRRRLFTINIQARHAEHDLGRIRDSISDLARHGMERAYGRTMLQTATSTRMRHLEQRLDNDGHLAALSEKARAASHGTAGA